MEDKKLETQWLDEHRDQYMGQWVALNGSDLIVSGLDAVKVFKAAMASGVKTPFIAYITQNSL